MDRCALAAGVIGLIVAFGFTGSALAQGVTPPAAPLPPAEGPRTVNPDYDQFHVGNVNVKALLVDGDTVWVGTSGGLTRYDVATDSHKMYNTKNGLLSDGILHLDRFGNDVWVCTYGGGVSLLDIEHGTWRRYNIPNGMGDAFAYDVVHTRSGDTWIATWSGVNRVRGNRFDTLAAWDLFTVENTHGGLPNDWVYALAEGKNGDMWLGTEGGVARYAGGVWTHWNHADGLGADYERVKDQEESGFDPGTMSRHHAQQKEEQGISKISKPYNPNYVTALAVDKDGIVWVGTWGAGLSRYDGKSWKTLTMQDGLPSNHINVIVVKDEILWVGTANGLAKYNGNRFVTYGKKDGLFGDDVYSLAFGKSGTWVGSFGGLARLLKPL